MAKQRRTNSKISGHKSLAVLDNLQIAFVILKIGGVSQALAVLHFDRRAVYDEREDRLNFQTADFTLLLVVVENVTARSLFL